MLRGGRNTSELLRGEMDTFTFTSGVATFAFASSQPAQIVKDLLLLQMKPGCIGALRVVVWVQTLPLGGNRSGGASEIWTGSRGSPWAAELSATLDDCLVSCICILLWQLYFVFLFWTFIFMLQLNLRGGTNIWVIPCKATGFVAFLRASQPFFFKAFSLYPLKTLNIEYFCWFNTHTLNTCSAPWGAFNPIISLSTVSHVAWKHTTDPISHV